MAGDCGKMPKNHAALEYKILNEKEIEKMFNEKKASMPLTFNPQPPSIDTTAGL